MPVIGKTPVATNGTPAVAPRPVPTVTGIPKPRKAKPAEDDREIVYATPSADLRFGPKAMTMKQAIDLMGWETEEEYKVRMKSEGAAEGDVRKGGKGMVGFGDDYLLKDHKGRKVKCWHNLKNRPFTEDWAYALAQDILHSGPELELENRRWQPNGESVIIGDRAGVLSGQHRLAALILACQMWAVDDKWKRIWPRQPVLETVVVMGISESQTTTRTLDNVKPRSLTDVFYTSEIFAALPPSERRVCSRSLDSAVDLLWKRTGEEVHSEYQTHGESVDFLDRHPRLLHCVNYMHGENRDRAISNLKIQPGHCAALMYLMGSGNSDRDDYEKVYAEKPLKWDLAEKAQEFFIGLFADHPDFLPVREALAALVETEKHGRLVEKNGVLCRAWGAFREGQKIHPEDLKLAYGPDKNGNIRLLEYPTVSGIDLGDKKMVEEKEKEEEPTPEELETRKQLERDRRTKEHEAKIAAAKPAKGGGKK